LVPSQCQVIDLLVDGGKTVEAGRNSGLAKRGYRSDTWSKTS
jgi:hypothetical protein